MMSYTIPYCNPKYGQWQLMVDLPVESSIVAPAPSFQILKQNDNYITFTFIYYERIDNGRENDFAD